MIYVIIKISVYQIAHITNPMQLMSSVKVIFLSNYVTRILKINVNESHEHMNTASQRR